MIATQTKQDPIPVTLTRKQWDDIATVVHAFTFAAEDRNLIVAHRCIELDDLQLDGITHAITSQVMESGG